MSDPAQILSFGDLELDLGRRELRRAGKPVEIQPTPLRVLLYLAEHRDRTVPRRDLLDAIWPGIVVGDEALTTALAEARHAVGDDGTAQRVIRTQKGAGYRFVAEVVVRAGERALVAGATPERRLTAILSGDVAGYSRLIAQDEPGTIRTLRAWREQASALIEEHRGRLADFTGDNFLAEFPAASDAVECALEIQRVLEVRNAAIPEASRMRFRIGAHLGDVTHQDGRLFGEGVNVAARLQALAEPGGLCLSAPLVEMVRGKVALALEDLGAQELRNIPTPVRAYRVRLVPSLKSSASRRRVWRTLGVGALGIVIVAAIAGAFAWREREATPALAPIRSIAVLPLTNLSGDPEQEYYADGLTETLIAELSKLPGVRVISRSSVMQFKGAKTPLPEIARALNVDGVIEGSVMRAGKEVRITAQLIDARDDRHVWAEQYDRELARVLEIQREVARAVAKEVALSLTPEQVSRFTAPKPVDPRAQDAYFRGLSLRQRSAEDNRRAVIAFEEAVRIQPDNALAHAALSTALLFESGVIGAVSEEVRSARFAQMMAAAERAIALDDNLADAHIALASVLMNDWRWEGAQREFQRGFALGTSDPVNRSRYATLLMTLGQIDAAYAKMDEVVAAAPGDWFVRFRRAGLWMVSGRAEEALRELDLILSTDPARSLARAVRVETNWRLGRLSDAVTDQEQGEKLGPWPYCQYDSRQARGALETGGAKDYWELVARDPILLASRRAAAYAQLDRPDEAFAQLDVALDRREVWIAYLPVDTIFAPLHSDRRWPALLRRMNLPLQQAPAAD